MPSGNTYIQGQVTITTTATLIAVPNCGAGGIYLTNSSGSADPVVLGGSNVTATGATAGPTLAVGQSLIFPTSAGPTTLYGICAAGSATVTFAYSAV